MRFGPGPDHRRGCGHAAERVAGDGARTPAPRGKMPLVSHPAAFWIEHLRLAPHPEGGHFRETYRAAERSRRARPSGPLRRTRVFVHGDLLLAARRRGLRPSPDQVRRALALLRGRSPGRVGDRPGRSPARPHPRSRSRCGPALAGDRARRRLVRRRRASRDRLCPRRLHGRARASSSPTSSWPTAAPSCGATRNTRRLASGANPTIADLTRAPRCRSKPPHLREV